MNPTPPYHDLPGNVALPGNSTTSIRPENDEGPVEYKLKLYRTGGQRFEQLVTQLRFRLSEGSGVAWYYLGVMDDGHLLGLEADELASTFASLQAMAHSAGAQCRVERTLPGTQGQCLCAKVWLSATEHVRFQDVRVAVAGSMDAGKSTLVAVLTQGTYGAPLLDNGRGGARTSVFRHKHELESGRTSSLNHTTLGYDQEGHVLNYEGCKPLTQREIARAADTVIGFVDLGGHPRYLKTALYGLTCMAPHYMLLCCSARDGMGDMGMTHLAAALALEVPVIMTLTKVDGLDQSTIDLAEQQLRDLLIQAVGPTHHTALDILPITTPHTARAAATRLRPARATPPSSTPTPSHPPPTLVVPLVRVSCVTGAGLEALHALLGALQGSRRVGPSCVEEDVLFQSNREFEVAGVGRVMAGTLLQGGVSLGQQLQVVGGGGGGGMVQVTSIHRSHVSVEVLGPDHTATLAITPLSSRTTPLTPPPHGHTHQHNTLQPDDNHTQQPIQQALPVGIPKPMYPIDIDSVFAAAVAVAGDGVGVDEDDPFADMMMGGFDDVEEEGSGGSGRNTHGSGKNTHCHTRDTTNNNQKGPVVGQHVGQHNNGHGQHGRDVPCRPTTNASNTSERSDGYPIPRSRTRALHHRHRHHHASRHHDHASHTSQESGSVSSVLGSSPDVHSDDYSNPWTPHGRGERAVGGGGGRGSGSGGGVVGGRGGGGKEGILEAQRKSTSLRTARGDDADKHDNDNNSHKNNDEAMQVAPPPKTTTIVATAGHDDDTDNTHVDAHNTVNTPPYHQYTPHHPHYHHPHHHRRRHSSNNGGHRGAVLLGLTLPAVVCWRVECLLVLWSGVWPPRGLLSGRWPPHGVPSVSSSQHCSSDSGNERGSSPTTSSRAGSLGRRRSSRSLSMCLKQYHHNTIHQQQQRMAHSQPQPHTMVNDGVDHGVDHDAQKRTSESYDAPHHIRLTKSACSLPTEGVEVGEGEEDTPPGQWLAMHRQLLHVGHVRAEARVTSMQEIMDLDVRAPAGRATVVDWHDITPLLQAARAITATGPSLSGGGGSSPTSTQTAIVARVGFEFVRTPQWVRQGSRVLVHDRSVGALAAAGVVVHVE